MYMFKKTNNTTDLSNCMVRTTRGHHIWLDTMTSLNPRPVLPAGYHLSASQLIDLPQNVFSTLLTPSVLNA